MSLRHIDLAAAMTRLAERRIETAMEEGKFDNLPGAGKSLNLDPLPAEENARFMYWAMRLFKHNGVIPDEVQYRKTIDTLRGELASTHSEKRVADLVTAINGVIHKLNTMGTNVRQTDLSPLHLETELAEFRLRSKEVP